MVCHREDQHLVTLDRIDQRKREGPQYSPADSRLDLGPSVWTFSYESPDPCHFGEKARVEVVAVVVRRVPVGGF